MISKLKLIKYVVIFYFIVQSSVLSEIVKKIEVKGNLNPIKQVSQNSCYLTKLDHIRLAEKNTQYLNMQATLG